MKACAFCVAIVIAGGFMPVAKADGLKEQIVGMWLPVSQYVDQGGKKLEPFGSSPKGMVVYDAGGRFVLMLQRGDLPKFASNNA